jgi:hypothetical protein
MPNLQQLPECMNVAAGTVAAFTGNYGTAAVVALFTVLLGAGFCVARHKRRSGKLDKHLMDMRILRAKRRIKCWWGSGCVGHELLNKESLVN